MLNKVWLSKSIATPITCVISLNILIFNFPRGTELENFPRSKHNPVVMYKTVLWKTSQEA